MKMMTIASGSSGNCTYVGSENTGILVDVGVSKKKISDALRDVDRTFTDINGIVITHEHIDHIRGLGVISRAYGIPIYATEATIEEIKYTTSLGTLDYELFHSIKPDEPFMVGNIEVRAHSTWHDAADPVCYSLLCGEKKIVVATDMGGYDGYMVQALKDADALLVEANHDIRMLQVGPYPYSTKQRILSSYGHLCNEAGGKLIRAVLNDHIKTIFLGHLSKENNLPELAYAAVAAELEGNPFTDDVRDFHLQVANRDTHSALLDI